MRSGKQQGFGLTLILVLLIWLAVVIAGIALVRQHANHVYVRPADPTKLPKLPK